MEKAGLIEREPGKAKAPGRRWMLAHPREVDDLLKAAVALSEAVAERDHADREQTKRSMNRARAKRQGLREASEGKA